MSRTNKVRSEFTRLLHIGLVKGLMFFTHTHFPHTNTPYTPHTSHTYTHPQNTSHPPIHTQNKTKEKSKIIQTNKNKNKSNKQTNKQTNQINKCFPVTRLNCSTCAVYAFNGSEIAWYVNGNFFSWSEADQPCCKLKSYSWFMFFYIHANWLVGMFHDIRCKELSRLTHRNI